MTLLIPRRFAFHDEFNSVKASAAINNSACEPGPGTLTVVDTETCMSTIPNYGSSLADQTGVTFGGSNNRCSYADGYAWADFPTGFNFAAHAGLGRIVVMYDSAGRAAWGFLGAGGTGETLGNELVTNGEFDSDTGWVKGVGWTIADGKLVATSAPQTSWLYQLISTTKGRLCIGKVTIDSITNTIALMFSTSSGVGATFNTTGSKTAYFSIPYDGNNRMGFYVQASAAVTMQADAVSFKYIDTPSATGCLVYRDAACTVNGWHKPTAFNMNDTAYTFNIYQPTSGGKLFFQGGKATPAYGDPGIWYTTAITRAAGLICGVKVNSKFASTKNLLIGFDSDKAGAIPINAANLTASSIRLYISSTFGPVIYSFTAGVDITYLFILRASGFYVFAKNPTDNRYRLIGSDNSVTTTPLYFGISDYDATFKVDFIRQSKTLWLPTPLLSDSFTGSAGSNDGRLSDGLGHAETTGLGSGDSGVAWSGSSGAIDGSGRLVITPTLGSELATGNLVVGNWYIITATESNHFGTGLGVGYTFRATATTALDALNKVKQITLSTCYSMVSLSTKDVTIKAAFQETTGKSAGVILGMNEAGTSFIVARHDGNGNIALAICESGTYTSKASVAIAYSSDAELVVRRDNKEIWVWYNNTLIGSGPTTTLSDTENTNLSGLKAGMFSTSELNSFAYATAFYTGTNGEYNRLDYLVGN